MDVRAGSSVATQPFSKYYQPLLIQQLPKIEQVLFYLERKDKTEGTRKVNQKALVSLAEKANLNDPIQVELTIARSKRKIRTPDGKYIDGTQPTTKNWKAKLATAYGWYCKVHKIVWEDRPRYKADQRTIQPPTTEIIETFIAHCQRELPIKIQVSEETGLRPIEVTGEKGLRIRDIHPETNTITAVNTKGCDARPPIKVSEELIIKLQTLITQKQLSINEPIFSGKPETYGQTFREARNRIAKELNQPQIKTIRLYDLRHYYVTKRLRKLRDAEKTRQDVGHKLLNTTQKYMHLIATAQIEWDVVSTTDPERADQLLTDDYEYVLTKPNGEMTFRKPK